MKVQATVDRILMPTDDAGLQVGVRVTCESCGHQVECRGSGPRSVRKALAMLREECPLGEENWYETDED